MKRFAGVVLGCGLWGAALAALPPADEATKARAAELAAKNAWQRQVDGYLLCRAQDRITARFRKAADAAGGAAAVPVPACVNPPPFAYNAPPQKPLESSGAHSPTGTAAATPSMRQPSAVLAPPRSR
jgi:hypothetical protein